MKLHFGARTVLLGLASMAWGAAASAEVTRATDDSFVSRHEVVVKASPKQVWLALISPATWWTSEHTVRQCQEPDARSPSGGLLLRNHPRG